MRTLEIMSHLSMLDPVASTLSEAGGVLVEGVLVEGVVDIRCFSGGCDSSTSLISRLRLRRAARDQTAVVALTKYMSPSLAERVDVGRREYEKRLSSASDCNVAATASTGVVTGIEYDNVVRGGWTLYSAWETGRCERRPMVWIPWCQ